MQSPAAVALTPRLAAILRLDMPAADSLSTSRILRMGNLGPGIAPLPVEKERSHADSRITQRRQSPPSTGWSRSPGTGGRDQSERLVAINRNNWSQSSGARTASPAEPGELPLGFRVDQRL